VTGERPKLTAGEQLWDYLYVGDAADALAALGFAEKISGIYNVGSGQAYLLRTIMEMVRDMINPAFPLVFGEKPYKAQEVMHLEANIDKITRDTGWYPRISLEEGLRNLIASLRGRAS
jgi:nucleoside-diphosphate-sugar epimerase